MTRPVLATASIDEDGEPAAIRKAASASQGAGVRSAVGPPSVIPIGFRLRGLLGSERGTHQWHLDRPPVQQSPLVQSPWMETAAAGSPCRTGLRGWASGRWRR